MPVCLLPFVRQYTWRLLPFVCLYTRRLLPFVDCYLFGKQSLSALVVHGAVIQGNAMGIGVVKERA